MRPSPPSCRALAPGSALPWRRRTRSLGAVLGLVLLCACQRQDPLVPAGARPTALSAAVTSSPVDARSLAVKDLERRLAQDPALRAVSIQVAIIDGRVRLRGAAPDTATRRQVAERVVVMTGGLAVDNEVSVQPPAVHAVPARPAARATPGDASSAVTAQLRWVRATQDNEGLPFAVIDKQGARLWLYDASGRPRGSAPVLLGLARGDASVAGIGERPMEHILPVERITPAGRFVAEFGRNADGEDVYWVDYDAAISMHRVRATQPVEQRLRRLATPGAADNRISYGCINVPAAFFDRAVRPLFSGRRAVVYLLPETLPASTLFSSADPM